MNVGEGLVGVLIGAAVTLLAGLLTHEREKGKRESEEARWYGQLFLQRRFDALSKLHSVLVSCRISLGGTEIMAQQDSRAELEESRAGVKQYEVTLRQRQLELHRAFAEATIYLDQGDNKAIGRGVAEFKDVSNGVIARVEKFRAQLERGEGGELPWLTTEEWERSIELFRVPIECLKRLLTPQLPQGPKRTDTDTTTDT